MKTLLSKFICLLYIVSVAMCLTSCIDDDNNPNPSLITNFVVAETDASGILSRLRLDNGELHSIASQSINFGKPDTLFRCVASYAMENSGMKVYNITSVYSNPPIPLETFIERGYTEESLPRDPVKVVSVFKSGGYINMQLGVMTTGNSAHAYAFCEEGDGLYSLLHQRPVNDPESYTMTVFLSMPIPEGVETVTFSIPTYEGTYTRTF